MGRRRIEVRRRVNLEEHPAHRHMVAFKSLDPEAGLLALRRRGLLRESEVHPRLLLSLHALAAAGQVQVDWGIGGWQFFIIFDATGPRPIRPLPSGAARQSCE